MRSLTIIGFAVGTILTGCASTPGARSEPTARAAATPAHHDGHGKGKQAGMMAGTCPMHVLGTTVASTEVEGGARLSFTTAGGDVEELRQRVHRMAEKHDQADGPMAMGRQGAPPPGDGRGPHGARAGHEDGGQESMMKEGRMKMPAATATVEDITGGAGLILRPSDPAQLEALRQHVRMKAQRMATGACPMMSHADAG